MKRFNLTAKREAVNFALRRTAPGPVALEDDAVVLSQCSNDVVNGSTQRGDVVRLNGREHSDPKLIASEFAVGLGVDNSVGPKDLCNLSGINSIDKVNGADDM